LYSLKTKACFSFADHQGVPAQDDNPKIRSPGGSECPGGLVYFLIPKPSQFINPGILYIGLVPLPGAGIYTATKYGIEGFMESLRAELRLSDCDYVRTTVANAYLMRTSGDLPLLSNAG